MGGGRLSWVSVTGVFPVLATNSPTLSLKWGDVWKRLSASGSPICAPGRCLTVRATSSVAQCHQISLATAWSRGSSALPDSMTHTVVMLSTYARTFLLDHPPAQRRTAVRRLKASREEMLKAQSVMPGP